MCDIVKDKKIWGDGHCDKLETMLLQTFKTKPNHGAVQTKFCRPNTAH